MKTRNILFPGIIATIMMLASCRSPHVRTPEPHYPSVQEYAFVEEFDDDQNEWGFADPVNLAYGVVSQGTFKFDYNDDLYEAYYAVKFFGFNPDNDFTIETGFGSNNNMGVVFGYDDLNGTYGYSLTIDYDGYYALYDEGGNGYGPDLQEIVSPRRDNFVNPNGDWNDVKIEQKGDFWIGYINGVQAFKIRAQNMYGTGIGFVDVARTQGEVDYLEVHWFE